ncbi:MAG: 8-amino-7-oxononanoate synthase [Candidatus Omnitrophica bacterium]|nr:8-amino-7-oxononanoate synthase [Candidatus Omnitrophota bacterium]
MRKILRDELDAVKAEGLFRSMKVVSSAVGSDIVIDGDRQINFCSNDYLGLAGDSRLALAAEDAAERNGFGSRASRLLCGNFEEHVFLEKEIARLKGAEAALVFSSGYMANVGVISALVGREDVVFSDKLNHASIVDGIILSRAEMKRYAHNDVRMLEKLLKKSGDFRRKLIVTDTVFSMDGDVAPLKEMVVLAKKYGAWLMVDEAHAFGVLGPSGAGLAEELGVSGDIDIQMGTLSKAVGSLGAYVSGSNELIEYLVNSARSFIFTTAMPMPIAAASREAIRIMQDEPERRLKVMQSAAHLRTGLGRLGFDTLHSVTPIIPVVMGDARRALKYSSELSRRGILISAIRPPTVPKGTARLRVTVTASHTDDDISRCLKAFREVKALNL